MNIKKTFFKVKNLLKSMCCKKTLAPLKALRNACGAANAFSGALSLSQLI